MANALPAGIPQIEETRHSRESIVVADFENRTGRAALDTAVRDAFEQLLERGRALGDDLTSRPTEHRLYFKQTAYNWLAFSLDEPPCFDAAGARVPAPVVGVEAEREHRL